MTLLYFNDLSASFVSKVKCEKRANKNFGTKIKVWYKSSLWLYIIVAKVPWLMMEIVCDFCENLSVISS